MAGLDGFPILNDLNQFRSEKFNESHGFFSTSEKIEIDTKEKTKAWFVHKGISLIALAVNLAACTLGFSAMILSSCTLGVLKISIFSATLGNIKPTFPIGVLWLGERSIQSLGEFFINIGEILFDGVQISEIVGKEAMKSVRWITNAIGINRVVSKSVIFVTEKCKKAAKSLQTRFDFAMSQIVLDEQKLGSPKWKTIPGLQELDNRTYNTSCFFEFTEEQSRSIPTWFIHKGYSVINIPANVLATGICTVGFAAAIVATCIKIAFLVTTKHSFSVPIGTAHVGCAALASAGNVIRDSFSIFIDGGVLVYKVAEGLHICDSVVAVKAVITYTFEAIFS